MRRRIDSEASATLLRAMESGVTMTFKRAAELTGLNVRNARAHVHTLHATKQIHVLRWESNGPGPKYPVYAYGEYDDAPYPDVKRQKAYRRRARQCNPYFLLLGI